MAVYVTFSASTYFVRDDANQAHFQIARDENWLAWLQNNRAFTYISSSGDKANFVKDSRGYWAFSRRIGTTRHQKRAGNDIALYLQKPSDWDWIIRDWNEGKVARKFDYSQMQDWLLEIIENSDDSAIVEVAKEIAESLEVDIELNADDESEIEYNV